MQVIIETKTKTDIDFTAIKSAIKKHFLENNKKRQTDRQDLDLAVHFLDNNAMIDLNKRYRDKDYLTDVLSFSYLDNLMDHETLAGEIFISMEKAETQAKEKDNDLESEIYYLITHGYLHITGYLHDTDEQEAEMNQEEDTILIMSGGKHINR